MKTLLSFHQYSLSIILYDECVSFWVNLFDYFSKIPVLEFWQLSSIFTSKPVNIQFTLIYFGIVIADWKQNKEPAANACIFDPGKTHTMINCYKNLTIK